MARRRQAERRNIAPDPRFNSITVSRFVNKVMIGGKKTTAQSAVYHALEELEKDTERPGLEVFDQAVRNVTPALEVRSRRVGGATYQVPIEVTPQRGRSLAMRWLINGARSRKGLPMKDKLARELLDAARGEGAAVRRKEELHRMAEANRAFVHYRW